LEAELLFELLLPEDSFESSLESFDPVAAVLLPDAVLSEPVLCDADPLEAELCELVPPEVEPVALDPEASELPVPLDEPDVLDELVELDESLSSASASASLAEARFAFACVTASFSEVSSMVASFWPFFTVSSRATSTEVTVPEVGNPTEDWFDSETVPLRSRYSFTSPLVTVLVT
jgi:hypothetical protein